MNNTTNLLPPESTHRWKLALTITILSIVSIGVIAGLVIGLAGDKGAASQSVLAAVLPLLAAWVSTVLAYYYSSESIEAATQSVKDLMSPEEKLKSILVKDKMLKLYEILYFTYTDELNVQEMLNKLKTSGKGYRFPFLGEDKQPVFMLHSSAVAEAMVERSLAGDDLSTLTLKNLFDKVKGLKALAEGSFGVLVENATLADAKSEMQRINNCQDVFITENGRKDGAVIGWVTNRIIEQSSKV